MNEPKHIRMPLYILSLINGVVFLAGVCVSLSIGNNFGDNLVYSIIWLLVTLAVIMLIPYMVLYVRNHSKTPDDPDSRSGEGINVSLDEQTDKECNEEP